MATSLRLTSREARKKLKPQDAPYYVELRRGVHLGYRRHKGDAGSWLMREFRNGRYVKRRRAQATANRYLNVLKAILNSAFRKDPARVPSDAAWRRVRAFPKADQPRTRTH
jgi:hypothetical protein